MSPGLFIGAGLVLAVAAILMGFALAFFWPDKERDHRAHRILGAAYYIGMVQIVVGTVLMVARRVGAA